MAVLVCALCGTTLDTETDADAALAGLSWIVENEGGRESRYCPACARDHLRAIEAKLDVAHW